MCSQSWKNLVVFALVSCASEPASTQRTTTPVHAAQARPETRDESATPAIEVFELSANATSPFHEVLAGANGGPCYFVPDFHADGLRRVEFQYEFHSVRGSLACTDDVNEISSAIEERMPVIFTGLTVGDALGNMVALDLIFGPPGRLNNAGGIAGHTLAGWFEDRLVPDARHVLLIASDNVAADSFAAAAFRRFQSGGGGADVDAQIQQGLQQFSPALRTCLADAPGSALVYMHVGVEEPDPVRVAFSTWPMAKTECVRGVVQQFSMSEVPSETIAFLPIVVRSAPASNQ